jgi:hypothetical protein
MELLCVNGAASALEPITLVPLHITLTQATPAKLGENYFYFILLYRFKNQQDQH